MCKPRIMESTGRVRRGCSDPSTRATRMRNRGFTPAAPGRFFCEIFRMPCDYQAASLRRTARLPRSTAVLLRLIGRLLRGSGGDSAPHRRAHRDAIAHADFDSGRRPLAAFERLLELESVASESHQASSELHRADSASDQAAAPFHGRRAQVVTGARSRSTRPRRRWIAPWSSLGWSGTAVRSSRSLGSFAYRGPPVETSGHLVRPPEGVVECTGLLGAGDQQLGQIEDKVRSPEPRSDPEGAGRIQGGPPCERGSGSCEWVTHEAFGEPGRSNAGAGALA